jgi:hypothetical protein
MRLMTWRAISGRPDLEAGVAAAAAPARDDHHAVAVREHLGQHGAGLDVTHDGAGGHLHIDVVRVEPLHLLAAAAVHGLTLFHFPAQRKIFWCAIGIQFWLEVSTVCGLCRGVSMAKSSQVKLRNRRLLRLQRPNMAQVELRSGRDKCKPLPLWPSGARWCTFLRNPWSRDG